jgi:hypothetical protein
MFSPAESVMAEIKLRQGKQSEYSLLAQSCHFLFPSPFFPFRLFTSRVIREPLGILDFPGVPITGLSEKSKTSL